MEMIAMLSGLGQTSDRNAQSVDTAADRRSAEGLELLRQEAQDQYRSFWKGAAIFGVGILAGYFVGRASTRF